MKVNASLFKTLFLFIFYLFYVKIVSSIFGTTELSMIFADLLYLAVIVYCYKDKLKECRKKMFKKNIGKQILRAIGYALLLFVIYMAVGAVLFSFYPELGASDGNTEAIYSIYSVAAVYLIIKTLVFATIAEELLFKEAIRDIIKPNVLYIIISSFIYAFVNIMYDDLTLVVTWLYMIPYLLFAILLNIIYVKNDDNICLVFLIKFFYNLIPLAILLSGVGA